VVFVAAVYASGAMLVILHPRVHKLAIASLAVGLAFQFARMASRRSGVVTFMRRSIPWLAAFLTVAGFYSGALAPVLQRPRNPSQASTGSGAPNVLLIILDTVRALSVGVTPLGRETTPFLNGLQKRATTFQHAVAPAPWTTPTHASLLTGLWPHELADPWHPPYTLPGTLPSLPRVLADHGYSTAGFVANVQHAGREVGIGRWFRHFDDYRASLGELLISTRLGQFVFNSPRVRDATGYYDILGRRTAPMINDAFLKWLDEEERRPFFVMLNYFDAHEPYLPGEPFTEHFGPDERDKSLIGFTRARQAKRWEKRESPDEVPKELQAYEAAIAYMDRAVGDLFDALSRRGLLDQTIVIVTSDHGEQFGEHGQFDHANSLYRTALEVPLFIADPRSTKAVVVADPVSLRDLAAVPSALPGASLRPLMNGEDHVEVSLALSSLSPFPRPVSYVPIARGEMSSLITSRWHYILNGDGREELFDVTMAADQEEDLAASPEQVSVLESMRALVQALRPHRNR
jgi:arylsulfatase A-like enzyme